MTAKAGTEYKSLATATKKYVDQEKKARHLQKLLDAANKLFSELKAKAAELTVELAEYKSIRGKLCTRESERKTRDFAASFMGMKM